MASAPIEITLPGLTGFTLTMDLYPLGSDTASVTSLSLTEATNRKGTYTTTTTAGLSGIYLAMALEGSSVRGSGFVYMDDTINNHVVGLDTYGKIIGGGNSTISAVGARVVDVNGNNVALSSDISTLLTRIVGTLASGTHNPQSGDSYAVVNHGTYGNSAIYTSISTILNRIGSFAGSGVNTILGFFKALMKKDASVPSDLGGTYASSTDANEALSESIAAIDVGSGSGARTVVITINDGTNTLGHCKVRATNGAESYVVSTESDGTATFHLDDATWSIAVTKYGYTLATQSLIVTSNTSITYSMTQVAVTTPSAPNLSTGTLLCLGTDGLPEANVVISFRLTRGPGDTGYALDAEHFTATSDTDGNIEAAFIREATYDGKRGKGDWVSFTVGDVSSFNLPEILGRN